MTDAAPSVTPLRDGGVSIRLSLRERDLLRSLPEQLRPLLVGDEAAPTVQQRLFSRGYADDELERQYRELVGDDIVDQRLAALDAFAQTLAGGTEVRNRWRADLDADQASAWLSAVNDARLVLGALLGISEESDWEQDPDPDEPTRVVMYYLGWLEEALVGALTAGLADPTEQ